LLYLGPLLSDRYFFMSITKDLTSVDLFKFIASIMVVAIHTNPFISNIEADYWFTSVCRIGVPFFFVVGSYFFFRSNKPIWSYVNRLLLLYLVWFVIEIPFIYERFFIGYSFEEGIRNFIKGLLINNTFYASWYITASWQATLLVYLISRRSQALLYIVGALCAFTSVSNALYADLFDHPAWGSFTQLTSMCFASNSFIAAIPYCIIGRYIALNEDKLIKRRSGLKYLIIIFLSLGFIELLIGKQYYLMTDSFWSLYPISFVLVVLLISSSISINGDTSRLLRKMSILIYLIHCIVIRIMRSFADIQEGIILFIVTVLITISISYIIVKLSTKMKLLKYLY